MLEIIRSFTLIRKNLTSPLIRLYLVAFSLGIFLFSCKSSESLSVEGEYEAFDLPKHFFEKDKLYSYLTEINAYDRIITGILRIKKVDSNYYKVVFSNESGFQLMALSFKDGDMESHEVFDKLDKKIILNTLEKSIQLLFYPSLCKGVQKEKSNDLNVAICEEGKFLYRYFVDDNNHVSRIDVLKKEVLEKWVLFDSYENGIPQEIKINHENIQLSYHLKALKNG